MWKVIAFLVVSSVVAVDDSRVDAAPLKRAQPPALRNANIAADAVARTKADHISRFQFGRKAGAARPVVSSISVASDAYIHATYPKFSGHKASEKFHVVTTNLVDAAGYTWRTELLYSDVSHQVAAQRVQRLAKGSH